MGKTCGGLRDLTGQQDKAGFDVRGSGIHDGRSACRLRWWKQIGLRVGWERGHTGTWHYVGVHHDLRTHDHIAGPHDHVAPVYCRALIPAGR